MINGISLTCDRYAQNMKIPLILNGEIGYTALDCPRCDFTTGNRGLEDSKFTKVMIIDNIEKMKNTIEKNVIIY